MRLPKERVERKGRSIPVANYLDQDWREWLQGNRVELNAMDTPTFLDWLDGKMEQASGKLIPPLDVVADRLATRPRALSVTGWSRRLY